MIQTHRHPPTQTLGEAAGLHAALFLDRDGVINHDPGDYVCSPEDWHLLDGIAQLMRAAQVRGYRIIIITNQGGIGLGRYTREDLERIHLKMFHQLAEEGIQPDAVYACPHHPQTGACLCRKPEPLMIQKALHRFGLNPQQSLMIGDRERDIQAAKGAGVPGYLIPTNADLRHFAGPWTDWLRNTVALLLITLSLLGSSPTITAQNYTAQVYLDPACSQTMTVVDRLILQQEKCGDQIHWIAVFSDPTLTEKDCLKFLMDHNLAMALRRDPRQQNLSIYGIPQQPWLLITDNRSQTVYQGPLMEKIMPAPGKSVWENRIQKLVEKTTPSSSNSRPRATVKSPMIQGSGCPVRRR